MSPVGGVGEPGRLVFASIVSPSKASETNALLLAESIRDFAGSLSQAPIWFFTPGDREQLSMAIRNRLSNLDITLIPFNVDPEVLEFPFTGHAQAAALAEERARGQADLLAWLAANTVVLQEPEGFLLREGKTLGYRPVHHTLVGSCYDEPLDSFWTLIYRYCEVPEDRVFPMETHVDGTMIRPYFNAGILVTRPEKGLLGAWRDIYFRVYREPSFQEFYLQDGRYRVFVHQAVLSGVILSTLEKDEIQELPPVYNYPLHLYAEDVTDDRPSCLEELMTLRHEGFYKDPGWMGRMPAGEPLKRWLAERLPR